MFYGYKQCDCSQIVNMLTVYKFEKNLSRIEKSFQIEKCMSTNFNITRSSHYLLSVALLFADDFIKLVKLPLLLSRF